jgi:hypothetical protein
VNLSAREIRKSISSQKRVKRLAKGRCFGYGGQRYLFRDCLTKPRRLAISKTALVDSSSALEQLIDFEKLRKE